MRRARNIACMVERRGVSVYRGLVGKTEGNRPLGKPSRSWEDNNTKMDFQEVAIGGMDWTELTQHKDRWRAHTNAVWTGLS
jgi:hypothetical protein